MRQITEKQLNFARAYVGEANGSPTVAYRMAYNVETSNDSTASAAAAKILASPVVAAQISRFRQRTNDVFEITQLDVLRRWWAIASADPNALVRVERRCCRYCYGVDHAYQWRSAQEWAEAVAKELDNAKKDDRPAAPPSADGGFDFDHTLTPHAKCAMCRGDGQEQVIISDTRKLEGDAKLLYAGAVQKRDGIEIKMHSQSEALANIAKALKMFDGEKGSTNVSYNFDFSQNITAVEATKAYKQLMG